MGMHIGATWRIRWKDPRGVDDAGRRNLLIGQLSVASQFAISVFLHFAGYGTDTVLLTTGQESLFSNVMVSKVSFSSFQAKLLVKSPCVATDAA